MGEEVMNEAIAKGQDAISTVLSYVPDGLTPYVENATSWIEANPQLYIAISIALGFVIALLGYKLFKIVLFISGAIGGWFAGSIVVPFVYGKIAGGEPSDTAMLIGGAVCAILGGFLAIWIRKVVMFLCGVSIGYALGVYLYNAFLVPFVPEELVSMKYIPIVVGVICGLIIGALVLKIFKPVFIFMTAIGGGFLVASSIMGVVPTYNTYVELVILVAVALFGMIVQFKTNKD